SFVTATFVSSMNSGETDAAELSRWVSSADDGMTKCGISSRQRRSSSRRCCAVSAWEMGGSMMSTVVMSSSLAEDARSPRKVSMSRGEEFDLFREEIFLFGKEIDLLQQRDRCVVKKRSISSWKESIYSGKGINLFGERDRSVPANGSICSGKRSMCSGEGIDLFPEGIDP